MNTDLKYILVDDDYFTNILSNMMIQDTLGETDVKIFDKPENGLEYIKDNYDKAVGSTVLFLDINMPKMDGWEFLEQFKKYSSQIKQQISIYVLSSSVDHRDIEKANANQYVKGFISKPLEYEALVAIDGVQF